MSNEVEREVIRIWQLPREQWRDELMLLPKEKMLKNVLWPYRLAIGTRLKMAENLERAGCCYAGWPARNIEPHRET